MLLFLIQQMASGLFKVVARVCRTMTMANTGGVLDLLLIFLLGGFIVPNEILNWLIWGYWMSPLTYGFNAIAVNEMLAPRWINKLGLDNTTRLGISVLNNFDVFPEKKWYWIGVAVLVGFSVLFNILIHICAYVFFYPLGKKQTSLSEEEAHEMEAGQEETKEPRL